MKNLLKIFYKGVCVPAMLLAMAVPVSAAKPVHIPGERIEELDNLTFIEMINSVPLGDKAEADLIRKFQEKEGQNKLRKNSYKQNSPCNVEFFRNKEVLLITIPASELFEPNSTKLNEKAAGWLAPIKRYLKHPEDTYRVLLAMHTDNTGSDSYREELTQNRVDAIFDWFDDQNLDTTYLFPYAFSDDMPLRPNDTMDNRATNRRLEIYLVPGKAMVEEAKKGKIVF